MYVAQKMVLGISCVLYSSNYILEYFLFSTLQTVEPFYSGLDTLAAIFLLITRGA